MRFVKVARRRMGIAYELLGFFWTNKRWWILPIVIVLLLTSMVLILAQSPVVAPFIYTLF